MAGKYKRPSTKPLAGLPENDYIRAITMLDTPLAITLATRDPRSDFFKLIMNVAHERRLEQIWVHELYDHWAEQVRRESWQERVASLKEEMAAERKHAAVQKQNEAILAKANAEIPAEPVERSVSAIQKMLEHLTEKMIALQERKVVLTEQRQNLGEKVMALSQSILDTSQQLYTQQTERAKQLVDVFKSNVLLDANGEAIALTTVTQQKLLRAMTPTPMHHILHYNPGLRTHLHEVAAMPANKGMSAGETKCVMDAVASQISVAGALADQENISVKAIFALIKRNQAQLKVIKPHAEDIALCDQVIKKDIEKESSQQALQKVKDELLTVDRTIFKLQEKVEDLTSQKQLLTGLGATPRFTPPGQ